MLVLGIESSCDETAAAVLENGADLLSDVVNSQIQVHKKYGGVVPELASRKHIENIFPVVRTALDQAGKTLDDINVIAVTQGPGLIGSLLIGQSFAKSLAFVKNIPCIGVDHLSGHLLSVFLGKEKPAFPYIALVASGGHSSIFKVSSPHDFVLLGRTRDDAAGEAFDKVAKLLALGYPGGPIISELSKEGNPNGIEFPRAWLEKNSLDFSFSGVKTAVANYVRHQSEQGNVMPIPDICASFQEAAVEVLAEKAIKAAQMNKISHVVLAGGVAANPRLRELLEQRGAKAGLKVFLTPKEFCTDNAAMIAYAGYQLFLCHQDRPFMDMDVYSRSQFLCQQ